jgi:hypothetical protein
MITCLHAHQLFDRYLDGELSASLQTELHAHRLNCTACQNELSLLEACGDVIAMDRCEREVSASFTDRGLLAHRVQRPPKRRQWGRTFWLVGSPMAAAASIAFMMFMVVPTARTTVVGGLVEVPPRPFRDRIIERRIESGRPISEQERIEIAKAHEMPTDSFVASVLAPLVERSKNTYEGTRKGAEQFEMLLRMGNETLMARLRTPAECSSTPGAPEQAGTELDPLDPSFLPVSPADPESSKRTDSEDRAEAL